jgi:hypothetical protein
VSTTPARAYVGTEVGPKQGDLIGRIFAYCEIVSFCSFFITEAAQIFGLLFPWEKVVYQFQGLMG